MTINLSVVIASRGNCSNFTFIKNISKLHSVRELLLVIPYDYYDIAKKNFKFEKNIKLIKSRKKHQVFQRILGFKKAKYNLVLQIDDDCEISNSNIQQLIKFKYKLGTNTCIAPIMYDLKTKKKIHLHKMFSFKSILHSLLFFSKFGISRMGTISRAGTCYGVDPDYMKKSYLEVDWLPGGCVLHSKKNLILKNYFKIKTKGFCEDLIHSKILKNNGIKHFIIKNSKVYTISPQKLLYNIDLKSYINALKYFFSRTNKKRNINFYIWYLILFIRLKIKRWR